MSAVRPPFVTNPKKNRSAITNGSWILEGVDNRKPMGRRYRDLCMSFADDLGGASKLNPAQETTIRQLAAVIVESEKLQAAIVKGEAVNHEQLVRLSNLQARLIRQLGIKSAGSASSEPDLAAYLAGASE